MVRVTSPVNDGGRFSRSERSSSSPSSSSSGGGGTEGGIGPSVMMTRSGAAERTPPGKPSSATETSVTEGSAETSRADPAGRTGEEEVGDGASGPATSSEQAEKTDAVSPAAAASTRTENAGEGLRESTSGLSWKPSNARHARRSGRAERYRTADRAGGRTGRRDRWAAEEAGARPGG